MSEDNVIKRTDVFDKGHVHLYKAIAHDLLSNEDAVAQLKKLSHFKVASTCVIPRHNAQTDVIHFESTNMEATSYNLAKELEKLFLRAGLISKLADIFTLHVQGPDKVVGIYENPIMKGKQPEKVSTFTPAVGLHIRIVIVAIQVTVI